MLLSRQVLARSSRWYLVERQRVVEPTPVEGDPAWRAVARTQECVVLALQALLAPSCGIWCRMPSHVVSGRLPALFDQTITVRHCRPLLHWVSY